MAHRYYKYVRQEMLKNFQAGTGCRGVPMSLPRLVELVRACACVQGYVLGLFIEDRLLRRACVAVAPRACMSITMRTLHVTTRVCSHW